MDLHFQQYQLNAPLAPNSQHLLSPDSGVCQSSGHSASCYEFAHVLDYISDWKFAHKFMGYLCFLLYEVLAFYIFAFYLTVNFHLIHGSYSLILDTYTNYCHVLHTFYPSQVYFYLQWLLILNIVEIISDVWFNKFFFISIHDDIILNHQPKYSSFHLSP